MNYNLRPSFKAIRYFERMTNTSFIELELHPELIAQLLYCCLIAHPENNFKMTFEEACSSFIPKHGDELAILFAKEMEFINQFAQDDYIPQDDSSIDSSVNSSPMNEEKLFLSSLIPILVTDCHLDIDYVLNDFDYTDTKMFIENSISHKHDDMENQRFWTYLTIAPHLGSKSKIKDPEDLVEFTWEKNEKKDKAEARMKAERQRLIEIGLIKEDNLTEEEKP